MKSKKNSVNKNNVNKNDVNLTRFPNFRLFFQNNKFYKSKDCAIVCLYNTKENHISIKLPEYTKYN